MVMLLFLEVLHVDWGSALAVKIWEALGIVTSHCESGIPKDALRRYGN